MIAVISSRPSAGNCESIIPRSVANRETTGRGASDRAKGRATSWSRPIGPAGALEAGRRGQGRLEGEDPPRGPDRPRQGQAGVTAIGTDVEPGLARPGIGQQPVGELALGVAEDRRRVVVPRGHDPHPTQRTAHDPVSNMPARQQFPDE